MRNMRTVLRLMGAITLSTTAASSVVACKSKKKAIPQTSDTRTDLNTITVLTGLNLVADQNKFFKDFDSIIIKVFESKQHVLAPDYTLNYYLSKDETKLIDKNTRRQDTGQIYGIISSASNDPYWKGTTGFIMISIRTYTSAP